jgi:chemotaxis-related protein WspB
MLVLTFQVAGSPFAVAVGGVVEVVPRVATRPLPHSPGHLVGLLRYRGRAVPVVDLGILMVGVPSAERLDTRIILVDVGIHGGQASRFLGMVAERVGEVREVDESRRASSAPSIRDAPYLGSVYEVDEGLLQLIQPGRIIADDGFDS